MIAGTSPSPPVDFTIWSGTGAAVTRSCRLGARVERVPVDEPWQVLELPEFQEVFPEAVGVVGAS